LHREDLCWRDINTIDRRPDVLDDNGLPQNENENGKKPVGSVMKAPGGGMKPRCPLRVSAMRG
jgi:hypothetical protein